MLREVGGRRAFDRDAIEVIESLDLEIELQSDELPEARNLEGRAHADHVAQLHAAVLRLIELQRLLHVADEVAEDRPHGGHDLLRVLAGRALLLQRVRLAVRELELRGDRLGEVVASEREGAHPAARTVGDDEVGGRCADVEEDKRLVFLGNSAVKRKGVVERDRPERDRVRVGAELFGDEREVLAQRLLLDREEADLDLGRLGADEGVVVPLDVVDRERDLLIDLVLDEVRDLARRNRRELREAGEAAPLHPVEVHDDALSSELLLGRERGQRHLEHRHVLGGCTGVAVG